MIVKKLIDQITDKGLILFGWKDYREAEKLAREVVTDMKAFPVIDLSDVSKNKKYGSFDTSKLTDIFPPFPDFFIELEFTDLDGENHQIGFLVGCDKTTKSWEWYLVPVFRSKKGPVFTPYLLGMKFDFEGGIQDVSYKMVSDNADEELMKSSRDTFVFVMQGGMFYMAYSLSLLACQNVRLVTKDPPAKLNKKRIKRGKAPYRSYKVLSVDGGAPKTSNRYPKSEEEQNALKRPMAWQKFRGAKRTYTKERPLFGKWSGTWFFSGGERGSKKVGIRDKDYKVVRGGIDEGQNKTNSQS